jgi:hypothetical protein
VRGGAALLTAEGKVIRQSTGDIHRQIINQKTGEWHLADTQMRPSRAVNSPAVTGPTLSSDRASSTMRAGPGRTSLPAFAERNAATGWTLADRAPARSWRAPTRRCAQVQRRGRTAIRRVQGTAIPRLGRRTVATALRSRGVGDSVPELAAKLLREPD